MTGEFMAKRVKRHLRSSMLGGLAFCVAFSGIPGPHSPEFLRFGEAAAQSASIVRITESGSGIRKRLKLGLNKALVIDLPEEAHDILVADPSLADAVTRTSRRIYLFGKTVGQTNIFIFGEGGREIVSLDLEVERDISGLEANIRRFIPESDIKVEIVSDNIVLTGSVRTPQDSARAVQLADAFLKGGEATTRNISLTGGDNGGDAAIFAERRQVSQIVNMLTIEGEDQVTLKVTVAEVSRQVLKQLGFNGSIGNSNNGFEFSNPSNLGNAISTASKIASGSIGSGSLNFATYLNAMEQAGVVRTLAEPSLTAISGEQAKFYVGGDFRIAGIQEVTLDKDTNTPTITRETETVDYGITLNFKPVVLSPGRISLKIETNVSEPTYEGNVVTGNYGRNIPGSTYMSVRKRETSTTVELPSGGSIVIAGLVQDNVRQAMSGLPGMSKIPIFGTLFRSKDFIRNETELVIIATPYLVRPVARNQIARPDDNFNPENDAAMYFMNRVNKVYGRKDQVQAAPYQGSVGFIYK
ncbi:type II and III secretion system protein family protein [Rhizobium rhizogenes]|uniref:type II and III secretion system protein family protein n=1 Tax=Rhizobium rhizogenes TaxID=359 RepID=UPI0022BD7015|nr:type II and III secretion system protein family protein [Rhizobium rhizogenes]MCZ7484330.1 type II and III secretion system protein family protein [Rhizobium rhizogenes]